MRGGEQRAAVFLDRDGTIIRQVHHLVDPRQIRLLPGAAEAIRRLNRAGWAVVIVTNQSVVARGMTDERRMREINDEVLRRLTGRGAQVDRVESCPHHPAGKVARYRRRCRCRKPAPGMFLRAARILSLDLTRSVVIGDGAGDILAGKAIGAATILLLGGHGPAAAGGQKAARKALRASDRGRYAACAPDYTTTTLARAAEWWLSRERRSRRTGRSRTAVRAHSCAPPTTWAGDACSL